MSFLEEALDNYKAPTADEMEIVLPTRHQPKKEVEASEPREIGQHGGGADGSPATSEAHGDATSTAEAAPAPQRDEPDDGEHTDSTEEQLAARVQQAAAQAPEPEPEPEPEPDPEPAVEDIAAVAEHADEKKAQPAAVAAKQAGVSELLASMKGSSPRVFKRTAFSAGEKTPAVLIKRFPQPALDKLRIMLASPLGGEFAEAISAPALITAFLVATTGVEFDLDENTATAAEAFHNSDPRLSLVEDRLEQVLGGVDKLAASMRTVRERVGDTGKIVDTMDYSVAYLVADRVVRLAEPDTNEANVDVTQKKALVAREAIRARAAAQHTIEQERAKRSKA